MTADHSNVSLSRDQIRNLLAEHRDPDSDHVITLRPEGGWIVITATHVLPDGSIDQYASTEDCLSMHRNDQDRP